MGGAQQIIGITFGLPGLADLLPVLVHHQSVKKRSTTDRNCPVAEQIHGSGVLGGQQGGDDGFFQVLPGVLLADGLHPDQPPVEIDNGSALKLVGVLNVDSFAGDLVVIPMFDDFPDHGLDLAPHQLVDDRHSFSRDIRQNRDDHIADDLAAGGCNSAPDLPGGAAGQGQGGQQYKKVSTRKFYRHGIFSAI